VELKNRLARARAGRERRPQQVHAAVGVRLIHHAYVPAQIVQ
jgi:hypothetical protein